MNAKLVHRCLLVTLSASVGSGCKSNSRELGGPSPPDASIEGAPSSAAAESSRDTRSVDASEVVEAGVVDQTSATAEAGLSPRDAEVSVHTTPPVDAGDVVSGETLYDTGHFSHASTGSGSTDAGAPVAEPTTDGGQSAPLDSSSAEVSTPSARNYLPCEVEAIIASRCRVCHGQSGLAEEPLLDDWSQVRGVGALVVEVVEADEMPMIPPPLTDLEKATLAAWVSEGAKPTVHTEPPDCSPLEVTLERASRW